MPALQRREIQLRFVRRPAIDRQRAVHPYAHPVVADRAKGVHTRRQVDGASGVEDEALPHRIAEQWAVSLEVEAREA